MKNLFTVLCALSFIGLAACETSVNATVPPLPNSAFDLEKISAESVAGSVQGNTWMMESAIGSINSKGELQVLISQKGDVLTCQNQFFRKSGVAFTVPFHLGTYSFDMLRSDMYPVAFTYPPEGAVKEYVTVVSDKSQVVIDSINNNIIKGGLTARSFDPSYAANINGRFTVTLCN